MQVGDPLANAEVIRNPCNVSHDPPPAWPGDDGIRLACVARIEAAAKGQDLLLQVMARPEWRERITELNIFGSGPNELQLRRMADMLQLKNVHFRGFVTDLREVWRSNHLLLLPSRYEGLPLALVEAMWCGRAAIVTDVGGNAELCLDNETGFVARSPTVGDFNDAMQRAWSRRRDWPEMGMAARSRVEALMPRDAVGIFCSLLQACAQATRDETAAVSIGVV